MQSPRLVGVVLVVTCYALAAGATTVGHWIRTQVEVVGHGVTNDQDKTDGVDDGYVI